MFLKQRGAAGDFLPATGLMDATESGRGFDLECESITTDHPVLHGVSPRFSALTATGWYELRGGDDVVVHARVNGEPVAFSRRVGDGRVVVVGFDYRDYSRDSARLLANATRMVDDDFPRPKFVRGEVLQDGQVNITDATTLLEYLFFDGAEPDCLDAADVDDSARAGSRREPLTVSDAVHLLLWLFVGGRDVPAPGPIAHRSLAEACGRDTEFRDGLDCRRFEFCEAD